MEHQIAHAVVVQPHGAEQAGIIHLGSCVNLFNLEADRSVEYTLVSQNEVDAAAGRISSASPVGQALMGRAVGDEVQVTAPSGTIRFRVESIEG